MSTLRSAARGALCVALAVLLAVLLAGRARAQLEPPRVERGPASVTLAGVVVGPEGAPVEGAVVVSHAGGRCVSDASGRYRLALVVPEGTAEVRLTAIGGAGGNQLGTARAVPRGDGAPLEVEPLVLASGAACAPRWLPTFGPEPGANADVLCLAVFDDGAGPALFLGGEFTSAGGVPAAGIARWDGASWSVVGTGVAGEVLAGTAVGVHALAVYDDGGGPDLYAAGHFASAGGVPVGNIARWDGTSWSALGSGTDSVVRALAVHDDGGGLALFAGGSFLAAGGVNAFRAARWNGLAWSALDSFNNLVRALVVYDDGSGPELYAGGEFTIASGSSARRIARWDGSDWLPLGSGVNGAVHALVVHDDGSGPALHVGGGFTTAGGAPAERVAKWDGAAWSALGSGTDNLVHALAVHDEGSGPALYAGGTFTTVGGSAANAVARWDGAGWSALGSGLLTPSATAPVRTLSSFDSGSGPRLFAGGSLRTAGGQAANRIASWGGGSWGTLGDGIDGEVQALAVYDEGGGPALFAGGKFTSVGGVAASRVARWDGASWSALGAGVGTDGSIPVSDLAVSALAVHDDGGGPALYVGGNFSTAGAGAASRIARWNGLVWSPLGSGTGNAVEALASFDDGTGPALYAGGSFTSAGGAAASRIARWKGGTWSALGLGVTGTAPVGVASLTVFDDGGGPALFVGGHFETAGGLAVNHIARWNGAAWAPLGTGMTGSAFPDVLALLVLDEGGSSALHAAGRFTKAGGIVAVGVARWDGTSWSSVGSFPFFGSALAAFDGGSGPALHVAAEYLVGSVPHIGIARWDGATWQLLGGDMLSSVHELLAFDDGFGPSLFAAGGSIDSGDSYLARWGDPDREAPLLACPESVRALDEFGGPSGEVVSFTVTATDGCDPAPVVECLPPSGSLFPRGTTLVTCTATDASGNQATCQFSVTVALKTRRR